MIESPLVVKHIYMYVCFNNTLLYFKVSPTKIYFITKIGILYRLLCSNLIELLIFDTICRPTSILIFFFLLQLVTNLLLRANFFQFKSLTFKGTLNSFVCSFNKVT